MRWAWGAIAVLALQAARVFAGEPALEALRMNQLQYIGSHNSYHTRPSTAGAVRDWDYSHAPLDAQLDRGVRSFELDLHYKQGDFEVFHVPLVDEGSTCRKLADGLATVRKWSEAHPDHLPISFLFEFKSEGPRLDNRIQHVDAEGLNKLDALLCAAFPPDKRIKPDDIRQDAATLRDGIAKNGWPTVAAARGKVLFILHDDGHQRAMYTAEHPSLRGRAMFVRSDDNREDCATLVLDNPRDPRIGPMVTKGYFVRTRVDSGLRGSDDRKAGAFASGAHILSTDFPPGESQAETGYVVTFPENAAGRVNPVNGPAELKERTIAR